jgi:adenylate cyclase
MAKKKKKPVLKISLGTKFSFFVGLLLTCLMVTITVFIYNHEKQVLGNEIKQRGTAIAVNLTNNASEALTNNDDLTLSKLAKEAIQDPMTNYEEIDIISRIKEIITDEIITTKEKPEIKNEGILEAVVVKKDGTIASANDISRIGERYYTPSGIKPVSKENELLIQEYSKDKNKYYDVAVPLIAKYGKEKYLIGEVHLTISQMIISKTVLVAAVKIVLITLVALIAGIILSIIIVNLMVGPIKELVKGVNAIGQGNFDVQIRKQSHDEIGDLTDAFNSTAKSLKEKELLKGAFSTYVSDKVMEQVLKDPGKLSLHGTRVKATMLFTDIRGFTSMSENLQPEQVVSIINEYLTLQTDKVFKWEGLLDKFIGDCVMAVYGVPFIKSDDAYRAVRTAMDIREGVEKLNIVRKKREQTTVGIGIGINTGDVVSGNMGSPQKMDYTVIGDNVNLASRLEANAPAGSIYVSESTYNETKDKIYYEELPSIMVKGKKDPVKVYNPIKMKESV